MEPVDIPLKHLEVGQQMMGEEHRLGPLQVGIARHHHLPELLSPVYQRPLHPAEGSDGVVDHLLGVHSHIQSNLVVAGAPGMQAAGGGADELVQPAFNVHVQVFQRGVPGEAILLDLLPHPFQAIHNRVGVFLGNCPGSGQHLGVGDGAGNIMAVEAPVEVKRYGVVAAGHQLCLVSLLANQVPCAGVISAAPGKPPDS